MKLICANFKMNLLKNDIINYLNTINEKIPKENVVFFPNELYISYFKDKNYLVGSQNIAHLEHGSLTGETSVLELKEFGISYTIIGHSERREFFNDNKYISKKVELALKNNIKIVLCVGETFEEYNKNQTFEVIKKELNEALSNNINYLNNTNLIIAYEPIWAIGTSKIPTNECIENTISFIKDYLKTEFNLDIKVLYGGSVNNQNIATLEMIKNIDGYLVGGASLDANNFLTLIDNIKN